MNVENIIFDLGGVLIDWNPRYLYEKIFGTDREIDYFLNEIATPEWNEQQDGGRPLQEATEWLINRHPDFEKEIRAYYGRWEEMLGGAIEENVAILRSLHQNHRHNLYALTNWSAETFPKALELYEFLHLFEGIVVSGKEKIKKPDHKIYRLICDRYDLEPGKSLFIDDNLRNVESAKEFGFMTIHLHSSIRLGEKIEEYL